KEALAEGLIARLDALVEEDLALMREAADGPSRYYVRTSVWTGGALDTTFVAGAQLAQESHAAARGAVAGAREQGHEPVPGGGGDAARAGAAARADPRGGGRGGDGPRDPAARRRSVLRRRTRRRPAPVG